MSGGGTVGSMMGTSLAIWGSDASLWCPMGDTGVVMGFCGATCQSRPDGVAVGVMKVGSLVSRWGHDILMVCRLWVQRL